MIKMRVNKFQYAECCECGCTRDESLELFDIMLGGDIITVCDMCNNQLLRKALSASCMVDSRVKDKRDLEIIKMRQVRR